MVDLSDRSSEISCKPSEGINVKTCVDCGTSRTPLWRGGPAGPKSLCNACGIRSRKKRRALLGVTKEEKLKKSASGKTPSEQSSSSSSNSSTSSSRDCTSRSKLEESVKKNKLWAFGEDVAFQRPRSNTTQRKKMGEVERAASLLMALSCGSVYA